MSKTILTGDSSVTHSSGATGPPDLRFLHYNDVYHLSGGSRDPVGGAARFVSLADYYREAPEFASLPKLTTFFSGDAFNPSLESSVTKGRHMVPIMNRIKTDVACLGNHDLDFGVEQFMHLAKQCEFPWLCANVVDPAVGGPIGKLKGTLVLESNGVKIGVIGLVEKEWLDTINTLPPNLQYTDAVEKAKELVPQLRAGGAEIIVVVSHQREPNDVRLAQETPRGLIDIILGGHDHHYAHQIINDCHVIRSGCDFKQFSYIEARKKTNVGSIPGWHFDIIRREVTTEIPEDPETVQIVGKLSAALQAKMGQPIGFTSVPLDARFTTVRAKESNIGNFICDLMRYYYSADCAIMSGGTIRGDQIYPKGVLKVMDIVSCFPFEDPVVVIKLSGAKIIEALENGLSKVPALEGRFPQVSNIFLTYDPSREPGSRITSCKIGQEQIIPHKKYTCSTRAYMVKGKDGFAALSTAHGSEEVVDEESGVLISMIVRQYFLSLKILGKWRRGGRIRDLFKGLKQIKAREGELEETVADESNGEDDELRDDESDDEFDANDPHSGRGGHGEKHEDELPEPEESRAQDLTRRAGLKWARLAGVKEHATQELEIDWTRSVAPRVEGRICTV
ncbi:Metallo-dependent phosphatase-like protein [Tirmania nivea]|nr:Metallo-dependent phosphatase-like protein [Tirmania nivea]